MLTSVAETNNHMEVLLDSLEEALEGLLDLVDALGLNSARHHLTDDLLDLSFTVQTWARAWNVTNSRDVLGNNKYSTSFRYNFIKWKKIKQINK